MRRILYYTSINLLIMSILWPAFAGSTAPSSDLSGDKAPKQVDVTADQSLEWYQDQQIYVARGNAKAIRGELIVEADLLTAHEREKQKQASGEKVKPVVKSTGNSDTGDIDLMTAEGHVRITNPRQKVTGDHAIYDLNKHIMVVTGKDLVYRTEKDTVTARDSLEYWEDKKIAVARGNAVGVREDRHVEGDILTAEFRDTPNGQNELWKMTSEGHVVVITKSDVSRGDHMVYDVNRDIAIISGHVKITRPDGTELTGDVGEVDFSNNQSRLLNKGHGRVHALLQSKNSPKSSTGKAVSSVSNP